MKTKNILLVEGASDQKFFNQLLTGLHHQVEIEPKIPRDIDARIFRNGLQPLYLQLKLQVDLLIRGQISTLGVIVDADHPTQELNGFNKRRDQLTSILRDKGFAITDMPNQEGNGEIFLHPSGAKIGIWIMPNHFSDGMIEDLLIGTVKTDQHDLLSHAKITIENLGELKTFAPHHDSKAHLSTWLAWQKEPGISPSYAYHQELFDKDHPNFIALSAWLTRVFQ
ncbi:MAG: hypothetical protein BWK73_10535 [Thiothrix lacustris]|uniref:DUF4276 domain-containing protein n=1 Tax=Thiothrix lacustris TaxID=525917 RepID=A0A1Y1QU82_9GAMM|nr:MAG: hypothetical protein BWK73_10535 [Thiothrix lacustris]